jgi:hypothetical protein
MFTRRRLFQLLILAISILCIIAGITLSALDFLKYGIPLIIVGGFGIILTWCDSRCSPPVDNFPLEAVVVVSHPKQPSIQK